MGLQLQFLYKPKYECMHTERMVRVFTSNYPEGAKSECLRLGPKQRRLQQSDGNNHCVERLVVVSIHRGYVGHLGEIVPVRPEHIILLPPVVYMKESSALASRICITYFVKFTGEDFESKNFSYCQFIWQGT